MAKKYGFEMKCQADSPSENRPLKPPGARSKIIDQQQSCIDGQITKQVRIKPHLASLQPGLADLFLFKFLLLLQNCSLEDFGINSDFPGSIDQVLMTDRIRLLQL